MKSDLPPNSRRSLDYASLIATLKLLEGEQVCLIISGGPNDRASRIQAMGKLQHYAYGDWADGFAVGNGARVLLFEPDFVDASLHTCDGTTFFSVGVTLAEVVFAIGTPALIGADDEFYAFP